MKHLIDVAAQLGEKTLPISSSSSSSSSQQGSASTSGGNAIEPPSPTHSSSTRAGDNAPMDKDTFSSAPTADAATPPLSNISSLTLVQHQPINYCKELGFLGRVLHLELIDNPVCDLALLRYFVSFHLPHLRTFNGTPLTDREKEDAKKMLQPTKDLLKAHARKQKRFNTAAASVPTSSSSKKRSVVDTKPPRVPSGSSSSAQPAGATKGFQEQLELQRVRI